MVLHRLYLSSDQADKYPLGVDRTDSVVFDLSPGISLSGREAMYPNVNPANNTFVLLLAGDELLDVTIPPAQYTSGEALSSVINSTSQMISSGVSSSFDSATNKLTFAHSQGGNISIATNETTTAHKILGMNKQFNITIPSGTPTTAPQFGLARAAKQGAIEEYPVGDGRYVADLAVFDIAENGKMKLVKLIEVVVTNPPSKEKLEYYKELGLECEVVYIEKEPPRPRQSVPPPRLPRPSPSLSSSSSTSSSSTPCPPPMFTDDSDEEDCDEDGEGEE
ncbi:hypothetical protein T492DRAFT_836376 [Pavlovales sp. CCMP2436]|nr:hypothetical protein T492DRAFT_836376 [Pavlovales sp. CCMP2436]